jgi:hypothetical protein
LRQFAITLGDRRYRVRGFAKNFSYSIRAVTLLFQHRLKMERGDYRFSRRDVRPHTGWSETQVKRHLHKLEELEYMIVRRGERGQSYVYELYFERPADPRQLFLPRLSLCG